MVGTSKNFVLQISLGCKLLVDSGAQVNVIPPSINDRHTPSKGPALQAVNRSSIQTFPKRIVPIVIGDRYFSWNFVITNVSQPLLGPSFLCTQGVILDLKGYRLINTKSYAIIPLTRTTQVSPCISMVAVQVGGALSDILRDFLSITMLNFSSTVLKHGVEHYVQTQGPPISARARRLPLDKLKLAKEEFDKLCIIVVQVL